MYGSLFYLIRFHQYKDYTKSRV